MRKKKAHRFKQKKRRRRQRRRLGRSVEPVKVSDVPLYHYTYAEAMLGILDSRCIRPSKNPMYGGARLTWLSDNQELEPTALALYAGSGASIDETSKALGGLYRIEVGHTALIVPYLVWKDSQGLDTQKMLNILEVGTALVGARPSDHFVVDGSIAEEHWVRIQLWRESGWADIAADDISYLYEGNPPPSYFDALYKLAA